jgi:hypothetical protein
MTSKWLVPEPEAAVDARAKLSASLGLTVDMVQQVAWTLAEGLVNPNRDVHETEYLRQALHVNVLVGFPGRFGGKRVRLSKADWGTAVWRARRIRTAIEVERVVEAALQADDHTGRPFAVTVRLYADPEPLRRAAEQLQHEGWTLADEQTIGRRQVRLVRRVALEEVAALSDRVQDLADGCEVEYGGIVALVLRPGPGG